jgi:hypothetical protein
MAAQNTVNQLRLVPIPPDPPDTKYLDLTPDQDVEVDRIVDEGLGNYSEALRMVGALPLQTNVAIVPARTVKPSIEADKPRPVPSSRQAPKGRRPVNKSRLNFAGKRTADTVVPDIWPYNNIRPST